MSQISTPPLNTESIGPGVIVIRDSTKDGIEQDPHLSRNNSIVIQIKDSRTDDNGRQKPKKRRHRRSGYKYWTRRMCFGKDRRAEEEEKQKHKARHFIKKELRRHLAEFIGSFFIVLFIAGIQVSQTFAPEGHVANIDKGLIGGLLLAGLIYCFGNVSGAHFNPCVTLAFYLRGTFNFYRTITYILIQFAGAVSGAGVLYSIFGDVAGLGTTVPARGLLAKEAFGLEILITFILITVILTTAVNSQILGATSGLAVGATFGALELFAWNLTGASANPWRTIGPSLVSGEGWRTYWAYIAGPLIGMVIAVIVQRLLVTGVERENIKGIGTGEGKNGKQDDEEDDDE